MQIQPHCSVTSQRTRARPADLPAGFSQRDYANVGGVDVCIFTRSGGCDAAAAAPFVLNDVLVRLDR
jgi:hypothetical protein